MITGARHLGRSLLVMLITAAVYAVISWFALRLSLAADYASPMYPSAGLALAATMTFGWPGALGAALGAAGINVWHAWSMGHLQPELLYVMPLVIGVGAALQAWAGAWLVNFHLGPRVGLRNPSEFLRFGLWGGVVACLLNATLSTTALAVIGGIAPTEVTSTWFTWWMGDLLGVLIGAPIVLTLIGRPRADWSSRRLSVALPMVLGTSLLAFAYTQFHGWEHDRLNETFSHSAGNAAKAADQQLEEAIYALRSVQAVLASRETGNATLLKSASEWWLSHAKGLRALGYGERVPRTQIAAFEAAARGDALPGYRVVDRTFASQPAATDDYVVAIRAIEPMARNAAALGVNSLSVPAARPALLAAARSGEAAATRGFRLSQAAPDEPPGIVIYLALYRGRPASDAERLAAWRGTVFATVSLEEALRAVMDRANTGLHWCLVDPAADEGGPRLAGDDGCERADAADFHAARKLTLAGQTWDLRLWAKSRDLPGGLNSASWLFAIVGLAATSMLGLLLLTVTGRARRIEMAVEERTQALSVENLERRNAESALRQSEQRLRSILDHVPIGVVFLDGSGQILEANPSVCMMVGRSADEMSTLNVQSLAHPDARAEIEQRVRQLAMGDVRAGVGQIRLLRRDGGALIVRATLSALPGGPGHAVRLVGVIEDITEQLRLAEMERARDAAVASSNAKSEFVSRMSHELRTPLNAMLGFAQLLGMDREPALGPRQAGWAAQIQHAGWHLLELINETLDLSRIESGLVHLQRREVAVGPMVEASLALVANAAHKQQVKVHTDPAENALGVMADETRLKQVLTNLLSNAVKYNREGGEIHIRTAAVDDKTVEISIEDTGLGMSPAQLARLFQPYDRLGREGSGIDGIGIGLVISRRLAELMGGELHARSVEGAGSTFSLRLPRAAPRNTAPHIEHESDGLTPRYQQRLVRYIEDNETNVEIMRGIVAQRPQITLEVSMNGLDGLAAVRSRRPDLILLDMHLPDIDGLELLRHLKNDDQVADVPVIVVSADATPAHVEEALTLGAMHYATKPVDMVRFMHVLDETLAEMDTRWG